jgi:hypothetical protein
MISFILAVTLFHLNALAQSPKATLTCEPLAQAGLRAGVAERYCVVKNLSNQTAVIESVQFHDSKCKWADPDSSPSKAPFSGNAGVRIKLRCEPLEEGYFNKDFTVNTRLSDNTLLSLKGKVEGNRPKSNAHPGPTSTYNPLKACANHLEGKDPEGRNIAKTLVQTAQCQNASGNQDSFARIMESVDALKTQKLAEELNNIDFRDSLISFWESYERLKGPIEPRTGEQALKVVLSGWEDWAAKTQNSLLLNQGGQILKDGILGYWKSYQEKTAKTPIKTLTAAERSQSIVDFNQAQAEATKLCGEINKKSREIFEGARQSTGEMPGMNSLNNRMNQSDVTASYGADSAQTIEKSQVHQQLEEMRKAYSPKLIAINEKILKTAGATLFADEKYRKMFPPISVKSCADAKASEGIIADTTDFLMGNQSLPRDGVRPITDADLTAGMKSYFDHIQNKIYSSQRNLVRGSQAQDLKDALIADPTLVSKLIEKHKGEPSAIAAICKEIRSIAAEDYAKGIGKRVIQWGIGMAAFALTLSGLGAAIGVPLMALNTASAVTAASLGLAGVNTGLIASDVSDASREQQLAQQAYAVADEKMRTGAYNSLSAADERADQAKDRAIEDLVFTWVPEATGAGALALMNKLKPNAKNLESFAKALDGEYAGLTPTQRAEILRKVETTDPKNLNDKWLKEQVAQIKKTRPAGASGKARPQDVLPGERVKTAESLLSRKLTPAQKLALERSHMVGAGEAGRAPGTKASLYNYTPAQIRKKYQVLSDAGFDKAEIKKLMDNEVVGLFDGFLSNEQLASRWVKEIDQQAGDGVIRIRADIGEMHVVKIGDQYYQVNPESGNAYLISASELKDELIYIKQANGSLKVQPATGWQFSEIDPPFKVGDVFTHEHSAGARGSLMVETTGTVVAKGKGWVMLKTADGRSHFVAYNSRTQEYIKGFTPSVVTKDREFAQAGNVSSPRNEEFIRAEQMRMKNEAEIKPIGNSGFSLGDPILVQRSSGGQSKAIISKNLGDGKVEVKWVGPNGEEFTKNVSISNLKSIEIKRPPAQPLPRIEAASPKAVESFQSHLSQLYAEHGYYSVPTSAFSQWEGPGLTTLPDQGWKMHVSMNPERATEIAETVLPELRKRGITHKIAKDLADFSTWEGTQAGKFITIYPRNDQEAREIARLISDALEKKGLKDSDFIPIKGEDVSGTGVYARYGRFTDRPLKDSNGNVIPGSKDKIMGPDGRLYDDIRGGPTPDWVRPLRD